MVKFRIWLLLCLAWSALYAGQEPVGVTVFIHGTLMSALASKPHLVARYRANAFTPFDQIVGDNGLHEYFLAGAGAARASAELPIAEHFIIPAYHAAAQALGMVHAGDRYFTFGWCGLLDRQARLQEAEELYGALVAVRDEIVHNAGVEPEIRLVAHSYGGEVAQLLAEIEKQQSKNLRIAWLCMYGTPMHKGSVDCLLSPMFTTVVLVSSPGDWIQPLDVVSTDGHQRARTRMAAVVPDLAAFVQEHPGLRRCDVHLCVGKRTRHITHTNMWLMGRSRPIVRGFLDELPLVVLTPLFMKTLENDGFSQTSYRLTLQANATACWTCLACDEGLWCQRGSKPYKRAAGLCQLGECHECEAQLYQVLREWDLRAQATWRPCDHWRNVVFNHKNFEIAKSLLWPW